MTSATTPKTIDLGGGNSVQREAVAAGTIKPGSLIAKDANGAVVVHPTAGLAAEAAFAVEFDLTGRGIDDNYSSGDQVVYRVFPEGARVYARLKVGQNVANAALLQSGGDGTLIVTAAAKNVVAKALEAVNASAAEKRIRVEIVKGYTAA